MPTFEVQVALATSAEALFDFLVRPANLSRIMPPSTPVDVLEAPERLELGSRLVVDQDGFELASEAWESTGTVAGDTATGSLRDPDGMSHAWTLHAAPKGSLANLYSVMHSGCRTGVIVLDDGKTEEPAVQGGWCNGEGLIKQVTPMLPLALTSEGLEISVDLDTGPESFFVQPHEIPY